MSEPRQPHVHRGEVLAITPTIQPEGCNPGYILLREFCGQYLVHNVEVDGQGEHQAYYWGHYFDVNEPNALKKAMRCFVNKIIAWHDIKTTKAPLDPFRDGETVSI